MREIDVDPLLQNLLRYYNRFKGFKPNDFIDSRKGLARLSRPPGPLIHVTDRFFYSDRILPGVARSVGDSIIVS